MNEAFWTVHTDLPREGPGEPEDVAWAAKIAGLKPNALICDAGCGPGGDIAALLAAAPEGHVTAVDSHADFVERIATSFPLDRVNARQSDMLEITGPYDLIWSAAAVYFNGIEAALSAWRNALAPGGHVAFSHPGYFTDTPSKGARDFWNGYDDVVTEFELRNEIEKAGYETLGIRRLSDEAWEAYYTPMEKRIAVLSEAAADDAELGEALEEHRAEIAGWRAHRDETGYFLAVCRPA